MGRSGIWFNLAKSISFNKHTDGYAHFGVTSKYPTSNLQMCQRALAAGYDSIQFLNHQQKYPCATSATSEFSNTNYEIVSTRLVGATSCCSANGTSPLIRAGWMGARPCTCNNSKNNINCVGVPYCRTDLGADCDG